MHDMTSPTHYTRSPVAEAIIDFQVELPEGIRLSDLEACQDAAYPQKKPANGSSITVDPGKGFSAHEIPGQSGFVFASADGRQLFHAHFGGVALHRLAPYEGWERLRDEARRLWGIYRRSARVKRVSRLAVRYISRLDLPSTNVEIKDYLRTSPEVSPDLPQGLAGFFMQLVIPQPDLKSTLLLREAPVPPPSPGGASIVLDVDLFRDDDIPPGEGDLWDLADRLRRRNEEVFGACLTEKAKELIE